MSDNREIMIQINNLKKRYKLGTIGGGTLTADLQSWWAKIRHKEDPNAKIGAKTYGKNESFMALNGINLTVRKGERLGIIGHNGAGKSTLLKLLSRVTGPTEGEICLNGRISSMLEVGTGFNPELTGRENVYLNGAILGMTKAEVDRKIDQIIEFSECAKFIDTPVKRYSSGMYVKLAFAVAAHLDSEILVMDEVLAVGDMKFQHKCLEKMADVSKGEGRTVLYVSHNMSTIRKLCDRCVVLKQGEVIFDGDVEQAIDIYMDEEKLTNQLEICYTDKNRARYLRNSHKISLLKFFLLNNDTYSFKDGDALKFKIYFSAKANLSGLGVRLEFRSLGDMPIASALLNEIINVENGKTYEKIFTLGLENFVPGKYKVHIVFFEGNKYKGTSYEYECIENAFGFEILPMASKMEWNTSYWGHIQVLSLRE